MISLNVTIGFLWATDLLRLHALRKSLNVVLHGHVDEFILRLGLHHSRSLSANCLYHALDINFAVQTLNEIQLIRWFDKSCHVLEIVPLLSICPMIISITINVPVRPIPALQWTITGPASETELCLVFTSWRKLKTQPGSEGTPWSGQALKNFKRLTSGLGKSQIILLTWKWYW